MLAWSYDYDIIYPYEAIKDILDSRANEQWEMQGNPLNWLDSEGSQTIMIFWKKSMPQVVKYSGILYVHPDFDR